MQLSILFWNIWLDNQINSQKSQQKLLDGLGCIIEKYQPDCIGLNEVMQHVESSAPFVLDFLKGLGYKNNYYAPASPFSDDWLIGSSLSSRLALDSITDISISADSSAKRKGYKGYSIKAITTKVILPNNEKIGLVIAHPLCLYPHNLINHYQGTSSLRRLLQTAAFSENTIIGGDFNEPSFMPRSFKNTTSEILNFKTGTLRYPTWRHKALHMTPLRSNLDQVYWTKKGSIQLTNFEIIDSDISDHRPVLAIFEV